MLLVECVEISVMVLLRLMNGTLHGAEHRPRRTVHICLSCHGQVLAFIKWCWPRFAPFFFLGTIASTMTCFLLVTFPCRKISFHIILNSVRVAKIQDEKNDEPHRARVLSWQQISIYKYSLLYNIQEDCQLLLRTYSKCFGTFFHQYALCTPCGNIVQRQCLHYRPLQCQRPMLSDRLCSCPELSVAQYHFRVFVIRLRNSHFVARCFLSYHCELLPPQTAGIPTGRASRTVFRISHAVHVGFCF